MGPFGVVLLLGLRSVPFTFLAITASLAGLGQEFEDAARVHGAGRAATLRLIWPMLAPAIWSALAIGFAESISDYGVAATLAYNSNFSLATYQLFAAIGNFPPSFPLASAMGTLLVAAIAIPLALQARALRGRSYQMLSGRTRQVIRRQLSRPGALAAVGGVGLFYVVALGIPGFGAVSASLLGDYGGSFTLTLANYRALLHETGQIGPLERSLIYAAVTSFITVTGGFVAAWLLAQRRAKSSRAQGNAKLWRSTAIFVTLDESGGYYDSGYIQPVSFFGDGSRVPMILVSPYARRDAVDHTYNDHVSILKFIEANWHLGPLSAQSEDNLPNATPEAYVPKVRPAIGNLMTMFDFHAPDFATIRLPRYAQPATGTALAPVINDLQR
jgi:ABC-type spermidine/putrescine transport system permease subunit II